MQAGEIVYLRYHGGPGVIHTRLLIGCVQDDEWMIVTPDEDDIYVEELARHNRICSTCAMLPMAGLLAEYRPTRCTALLQ